MFNFLNVYAYPTMQGMAESMQQRNSVSLKDALFVIGYNLWLSPLSALGLVGSIVRLFMWASQLLFPTGDMLLRDPAGSTARIQVYGATAHQEYVEMQARMLSAPAAVLTTWCGIQPASGLAVL